jgi:hypothetical protein
VFILIGVALGPSGAGVFSPRVLTALDPVVWAALALIGIFIGRGLDRLIRDSGARVFAASGIATAITVLVVASGLWALLRQWGMPLPVPPLAAALAAGLCASVSASRPRADGAPENERAARIARIADLDDIPLVVLGCVLVAVLGGESAAWRLSLTVVSACAFGAAGWLLLRPDEGAAGAVGDRGVFVTGAVLLLAGAGAYLGTSPLAGGCLAALLWARAPGRVDHVAAEDLRVLRHPVIALLLIVAGAQIALDAVGLWVAVAVVVLRLAAKLIGSFAIAPMIEAPSALVAEGLLPPGILGVACALNLELVMGTEYAWLVSAVALSVIAFEVLDRLLTPAAEEPR